MLQTWMLDAVLSKGLTGSTHAAQLSAVGPLAPGWMLWLPEQARFLRSTKDVKMRTL